MRVSAKADYALRALIEIAAGPADVPTRAEDVARRQAIPLGFLQIILADLRRADILASQRGHAGGWLLARPACEVSVADVIRAVGGPLVSVHDVRPEAVAYTGSATVLQLIWIAARSSLREVLESVALDALVTRQLPIQVMARTCVDDAWAPH